MLEFFFSDPNYSSFKPSLFTYDQLCQSHFVSQVKIKQPCLVLFWCCVNMSYSNHTGDSLHWIQEVWERNEVEGRVSQGGERLSERKRPPADWWPWGCSVQPEVGGSSSLGRRERRRGDGWYRQSGYKEKEQTEADRSGGSSLFAPRFLVESGEEWRWRNGEVEVNIPLWMQTVSLAGRQCSNPHGLLTPPRWQPAACFSWHTQTHRAREGERRKITPLKGMH